MKSNSINNVKSNNLTMKTLTILILSIFLFSFVVAETEDSLGTFKQSSCVKLIQTCANCSYVNISTVTYPNSSQALGQVAMTKVGTAYNYTFCDTNALGLYRVSGYGDDAGVTKVFTYTFTINPVGGLENNTTFFIILILVSLGLLLLGFMTHNYIFAFFSGLAFLITGVYGMIYGYGNISNLYTRAISYILIGFGALVTILSGLDLIQNIEGKDEVYEDD